MLKIQHLILFIAVVLLHATVYAQEVLPNVDVKLRSGKVLLSWKNEYKEPVKNISIQRSYDSLRYFSTIGSVLNPTNTENGFVDTKPIQVVATYYRLFVMFDSGKYVFSKSYRPYVDTSKIIAVQPLPESMPNEVAPTPIVTSPTQQQPTAEVVVTPPPPPPPNIFIPSKYVFTAKDNNVVINIPEAGIKKYYVKFFNEKDSLLFQIKPIPESYIIIEKVNFKHSGWFYFSLFDEHGELIEKHKFLIGKESFRKQPTYSESSR